MSRRALMVKAIAAALLSGGGALVAFALYIPAKAAVAQVLLEQAWQRVQAGDAHAKPWPWADITPIAEIVVPRLDERAIVLEGVNGQAMAFGPGHMPNTAAIGAEGTAVIAAHRDTLFAFLRRLVLGDLVSAETTDGSRTVYRVVATRIVRADASGIDPHDTGPNGSRLALVTCYPFTGIVHSPWRYVVLADRVEKKKTASRL